jgi:predicted Zn-dependent protease with MMP-like domain
MTHEEFESIVQEEFDTLPAPFKDAIENVRVIVEDAPSQKALEKTGYRSNSILLGLYEGVPLSVRGADYGVRPVVPDTITLYRRSIQFIARTEDDIRREIRSTLIHEIGHYFGMSERQIREAGY